jgi:hypothetical protein
MEHLLFRVAMLSMMLNMSLGFLEDETERCEH